MASRGVNKVILIGNLGADPEVRYMPSGDAMATLRLATTDTWKDKATGEKKDATEWHRVVLFGKLAEIAGQYLRKGSQVYIEGSLRTRKWQGQDGQDRYTTEIRADVMRMLDSRGGGSASMGSDAGDDFAPPQRNAPSGRSDASRAPSPEPGFSGDFDDDIPF